jgi:hypothetical protein
MENKEYKEWRKSEEKDGITKQVVVKECENGYLICIGESGYKNKEDYEGYFDNTKKYISTKNPLEEEKEVDKELESKEEWKEALDALGI